MTAEELDHLPWEFVATIHKKGCKVDIYTEATYGIVRTERIPLQWQRRCKSAIHYGYDGAVFLQKGAFLQACDKGLLQNNRSPDE